MHPFCLQASSSRATSARTVATMPTRSAWSGCPTTARERPLIPVSGANLQLTIRIFIIIVQLKFISEKNIFLFYPGYD